MKTGNTSVLVLLEQLVHSFLKQWKNRSEEEEVLHQRWGKSIRKRNNNTTNSQTLLLFTHKVLLDINTNIFLPTSMKNTAGVPTVRAAGAFHLITWAGEFHVRQEVTSVFLLLCWRAARCPESAERFLVLIVFFPFLLICLAPKKIRLARFHLRSNRKSAPLSSSPSSRRRGKSGVSTDAGAPLESVFFFYVSA